MRRYYGRLAAGAGRSDALRQVQREMAARGLHPYFWASFIVSGQPGPLTERFDPDAAAPHQPGSGRGARACTCQLTRASRLPTDTWLVLLLAGFTAMRLRRRHTRPRIREDDP